MPRLSLTDLTVLILLAEQADHGYTLRDRWPEGLADPASPSPSALYYSLDKLHAAGFTRLYHQPGRLAPDRKRYYLTKKGQKRLALEIAGWQEYIFRESDELAARLSVCQFRFAVLIYLKQRLRNPGCQSSTPAGMPS
jgi:DNA-binding PadR family transcriptional regulator